MTGKEKCQLLRNIRRQLAERNGIDYPHTECDYSGDCAGTCPVCDGELAALEIAETVRHEWTGEAQTYSIAGPLLTRKGVCEGFCKFFLCHCIQAGLPARIIPASCDGTAHSLIQVWDHGKARYLDITVLQEQPAFYRLFPCAILVKKHTLRLFGIRPGDVCTP